MNSTKPIICLMGATATGKTDLAITLSEHFPIEIISVDSAMVYRHMNIGTAKPSPEELKHHPHFLIDICEPEESYSAGRFRHDALQLIQEIQSRGNTPLLVGGTMLYFHVLQNGVAELPTASDEIRERLSQEAESQGWPAMHKKLEAIDPDIAAQLHPNDSQRIQRALEVYEITGQTMSSLQKNIDTEPFKQACINIILEPEDRAHLHKRIAQRFQTMMEAGFLDEVKQLQQRPELKAEMPALRSVGYRQAWSHINGEIDQETMIEKAIVATRQLAKRQITWLRRWENAHRYFYEDPKLHERVIAQLKGEAL